MRNFALRLFSHRLLAIARWDICFLRLRLVNILRRQRSAIRSYVRLMGDSKYLNLGSGPRGLPDRKWLNVEGFRDRNVHFTFDFSRSLPIDSNIFAGVFCEHVLEHFSLEGGRLLSSEVLRVLKPGGVFRVIVPDAEHVVRSYLTSPTKLLTYRADNPGSSTPMEVVNLFFRQRYEH